MFAVVDRSALYYHFTHNPPRGEGSLPRYVDSNDTCIFDAERFSPSLFSESMFGPGSVHLAVYDRRSRIRSKHILFRSYSNPLPSKSFMRVDDDICIASPELCFIEAGRRLEFLQQVELGFEMLGKYRLSADRKADLITGRNPLMTIASLGDYLESSHDFWGVQQARKALIYLKAGSESPAETKFAMLLGLPKKYGGEGFEGFSLNPEVALTSELTSVTGLSRLRMDCCFQEWKIELEYDSDEFHPDTPRSRERDALRRMLLQSLGYETFSVTNSLLRTPSQFYLLVKMLDRRLCRNVKRKGERQLEAQRNLRKLLFDPKERLGRQVKLWC